MLRKFAALLAALAVMSLAGCGYNDLQRQDEQIKAAWSEVLNQYQRRADLVPNLVNTVKGYAAQEADVLTAVTNARANVGAIKATPELVNDPAAFQKFMAAQSQLTSALSRLLVVAENYPQLKSDALFRDLQSQLEGTENRITVARKRYIDVGAGVQHDGALVPDQPDGDAVQDGRQAELHRRKRKGDQRAAEGGLRQESGRAHRAATRAQESVKTGIESSPRGAAKGFRATIPPPFLPPRHCHDHG